MVSSYLVAAARRSLIVMVSLLLAGVGCAPPDPLEPDCSCGSDGGTCSMSDVAEDQPESIDGDVVGPDLQSDGEGIDAVAIDLSPDGVELVCSGEPDCPESGVCSGMAAHCVKGDWVCDFGALVDFELGGETLCDGKDNDCDGDVDEALPGHGDCSVEGVCAEAVVVCSEGKWNCGTDALPGFEAGDETFADELDNDCDGEVDEGLTKLCTAGTQQCASSSSYQLCLPTQTGWGSAADCGVGTACMGAGVCTVEGEFRVNEFVQSPQTLPAVAAVGDSVVIVWESSGQDGDVEGIYYRAYDAAGGELLPESRANLFTTGAQQHPAVAGLGGEAFFVGWESNGQDGSGLGVYGRKFSITDSSSAEVVLSEVATGSQQDLALGSLAAGGIAAVWADADGGGKIVGGTVGGEGWLVGGDAELVAPGNLPMVNLAVAELAGGSVAVVFEKKNGFEWNLEGRMVSGVAGGDWSVLSTLDLPGNPDAIETSPKIAVSGSNVFLAWLREDADNISACVQLYDGGFGNPAEADCLAPKDTGIVALDIDALGDGTAVMAVQDGGSPDHVVKVARVGLDGKLGVFSELDADEMDLDGAVSVVGLGGGKALVAWSRVSVADGLDIWARFVQLD